MKRKSLGCAALVVGLLFLVILAGSVYMLSYSLTPESKGMHSYEAKYAQMEAIYPELKPWIDSLRQVKALRDTFVTMQTGERHHAIFMPARQKNNRVAVVVHGYTDNAVGMLHLGYMYNHNLGFNVLLPDLHAHGKSEGKAVQMGWKERRDVLRWVLIADSLFRDSTGRANIVVHGVSMGGATTMNLSGDETPAAVKCFVDDCGYSSAWDLFAYQLKEQFGLPPFPLMYTASTLCKLKYGWSFGENSPIDQVRRCHKPMLFIHGGKDTYVPTSMVYDLYRAKAGIKRLYVAPGSAHAQSYHDHKKEYTQIVREFVSKYFSAN